MAGSGPMPGYKMVLAGSMAGGIAGVVGNPAGTVPLITREEYVRANADFVRDYHGNRQRNQHRKRANLVSYRSGCKQISQNLPKRG
jgi:hypothetical protein